MGFCGTWFKCRFQRESGPIATAKEMRPLNTLNIPPAEFSEKWTKTLFVSIAMGLCEAQYMFLECYFLFFKWKKVCRKLLFYISESVLEYLLLLYLIWIFQHIKQLSLSSISGTDQWCIKQFIVTWRIQTELFEGNIQWRCRNASQQPGNLPSGVPFVLVLWCELAKYLNAQVYSPFLFHSDPLYARQQWFDD